MKSIQTDELKTLMSREDDLTLINTLDAKHFNETRIPGSINVPQSEDGFAEKVEQAVGGKSQPVVVYCASQECNSSTQAAEKLDDAGFSQVIDYEPGAKGWQESGESIAS